MYLRPNHLCRTPVRVIKNCFNRFNVKWIRVMRIVRFSSISRNGCSKHKVIFLQPLGVISSAFSLACLQATPERERVANSNRSHDKTAITPPGSIFKNWFWNDDKRLSPTKSHSHKAQAVVDSDTCSDEMNTYQLPTIKYLIVDKLRPEVLVLNRRVMIYPRSCPPHSPPPHRL